MNENLYANTEIFAIESFRVHGPVSEARVEAAEAALGLRFPPSYRNFLLHLGAIDDIAGLPNPPLPGEWPRFFDVVERSNTMLTDLHGNRFERHLICLDSNGDDFSFYLDASKGEPDGEYRS